MTAIQAGGVFSVNHPRMNLYMNTPIILNQAKTVLGHGGVFFI
jgi:hypothetical protein